MFLLCFCALAVAGQYLVTPVNQPGAAGVPSWFSTFTVVRLGPTMALVSLSGTIGTPFPSPPGPPSLVPGGIANQTEQALSNVVSAIAFAYKSTFPTSSAQQDWRRTISKCRVYQATLSNDDAMLFEKTYSNFFAGIAPPARVAFQGADLVADALVELECDAYLQQAN